MYRVLLFTVLFLGISFSPQSSLILKATRFSLFAQYIVSINITSTSMSCTTTPFDEIVQYNYYQGSIDSTTQSYSIASSSSVFFYFLNNGSYVTYAPNIQRILIISSTTNNGLAYILYYNNTGTPILLVDIVNINDLTLKNRITFQENQIRFLSGHPILYKDDKLYAEAQNLNSKYNQITELNMDGTINSVNWALGWISLFESPSCPNKIFGAQFGTLYSIDSTSGLLTPLIMISCPSPIDQQFTQYAIDFNQQKIIAMSYCGTVPLLYLYDFTGNFIASYNNFGGCAGLQFYGIQLIPTNGGSSSQTICPGPVSPDSPSSDFSFYFYVTTGVIVFIILMIILISIIYTCNLNRKIKGNYIRINHEGKPYQYNPSSPSIQDILTISGGQINTNDIQMKELIGQGSFANVYRGIFHETEVAVKVIKSIALKDMQKSLHEEANIMITLRHPQVVLFMGACIKHPDLFIVTEFMAHGSIRELLDNAELIIEQEHIRKFSIDACKGMAYLHSRKILHRDLKTHNLLVDTNWTVKVADFGLSRSVGETDATMTACGTPSWAAPEVLRRDHYTHKADVYSFAICLWEMVTRKRPYGTLKPYQVVISVAAEGLRPDLEGDLIPTYFAVMIKQCWNDNHEDRPEFTQLRDDLEALILPEPENPYPSNYSINRSSRSLSINHGPIDSRSSHELYPRKIGSNK